jgi:hypothetical protein
MGVKIAYDVEILKYAAYMITAWGKQNEKSAIRG